jgi:polyisoprenoid-binding protein YceI
MKIWTLLALAGTLFVAGCAGTPAEAPAGEPTAAMAEPTEAAAPTTESSAMSAEAKTFVIDPAASTVTYEVGETFIRDGNRFAVAIGTTNTLNGEVALDYANPANSKIGPLTVDISTFKSDSDRRDQRIRDEWLESAKFPTVTVLGTTIGEIANAQEGQDLSFQVTADTTIRDVTKPLTYNVTAKLEGDNLTGTATTEFKMTDFGFSPPDIAGILKSEDDVKVQVAFVAKAKQ